ncbi:YobA family protein [Saccharibacillus sp. JS10]|uniref:YobA family protein n=1 Tax=Saccharibacillus sp. JS10 TaxID=2950552 RepID=UPI00210BAFFD|nr:YobA family protein [Saccharibacillus sp. JS10]MCQ4087510.1 YobA family protein [Saccharibacillus sp. JS10]
MKSSAGNQKAEDNFVLITSGYVVDVNDSNQILVVSPEQQNSVHDASWVSVPADSPQITLGMQVKVSVKPGTGIEDPYPRNFQADRIEVEPEVKPEGARLSRDQAVNKALEQFEAGESIPIVLKADYDQGHEKWKIKLKTDQSKSQPVWREVADVI